jgi:hypothetical protein
VEKVVIFGLKKECGIEIKMNFLIKKVGDVHIMIKS